MSKIPEWMEGKRVRGWERKRELSNESNHKFTVKVDKFGFSFDNNLIYTNRVQIVDMCTCRCVCSAQIMETDVVQNMKILLSNSHSFFNFILGDDDKIDWIEENEWIIKNLVLNLVEMVF